MVFNELKENISQISEETESYLEVTKEYYKLSLFKVLMKSISSFIKAAFLSFIVFLALVMLSFAASYGIGRAMNNLFYGFLCVGLLYVLLGIVFYLVGKRMDKPLLKRFSEYYFEEI